MNAVTITLTHRQASFLAERVANGLSGYIANDVPHDGTPASILAAWRKENVLWKKNPFRGRGSGPRTRQAALEAEADRKFVDLESRILARIIAALSAGEGGAA